jgi:hypothetical protein
MCNYTQVLIMEWKPASIEGIKGLNGLGVGSANYREYFDRMQDIKRANEIKNSKSASRANKQDADQLLKEASWAMERMGITHGVAITFNPSPMPPLETELKYAADNGLKIKKCEDGRYRWFKPVME